MNNKRKMKKKTLYVDKILPSTQIEAHYQERESMSYCKASSPQNMPDMYSSGNFNDQGTYIIIYCPQTGKGQCNECFNLCLKILEE
jgi:hypothetical protein